MTFEDSLDFQFVNQARGIVRVIACTEAAKARLRYRQDWAWIIDSDRDLMLEHGAARDLCDRMVEESFEVEGDI